MAVDLEKNRNDIINAWKDVVDSKTDTDWLVSLLFLEFILIEEKF